VANSRRRPPPKASAAKARPVKARPAKARTQAVKAAASREAVIKARAKTAAKSAAKSAAKVAAKAASRVSAKARAPRISADGKAAFPLPKTSFRVFIGSEEVHVASVSPLHLADTDYTDPDLRQTVTLRRAVSNSRIFYDWNLACRAGKKDTRTVTITLLDSPGGRPAGIWQLTGASAVRWTGPDLNAMAHEIAMEELELIYDSIAWRSRT